MYCMIIIFSVFMLDFFSKLIVIKTIPFGAHINVVYFFDIVHTKNLGVSFSLLYNHHKMGPLFLSFLSALVVLFLIKAIRKTNNLHAKLALSAVIGGALGNIYDRFIYGGVIDFLSFHINNYYWPAFNVADSFIVCGIFFYILKSKK